ncbi:MAG: hypothetical protein ACTII7_09795, partial [Galactobacter sp.]
GLEYRMKSPESLARKIAAKETAASESGKPVAAHDIGAKVHDVLRYTVASRDQDSVVDTLKRTIHSLRAAGMTIPAIEDKYSGTEYKGIHLDAITPDGVHAEVQVHSRKGLEIKEKSHPHYEISRDTTKRYDRRERAAARQACKRLYADLPTPPGLADLTEIEGVPIKRDG